MFSCIFLKAAFISPFRALSCYQLYRAYSPSAAFSCLQLFSAVTASWACIALPGLLSPIWALVIIFMKATQSPTLSSMPNYGLTSPVWPILGYLWAYAFSGLLSPSMGLCSPFWAFKLLTAAQLFAKHCIAGPIYGPYLWTQIYFLDAFMNACIHPWMHSNL